MIRPRVDRRTAPFFGQYLGPLAAQFLHACPDHRKVVSGAVARALAAQLLHARPDHRKIVSGARSGRVSSVFLLIVMWDYPTAAIGSIRVGMRARFRAG